MLLLKQHRNQQQNGNTSSPKARTSELTTLARNQELALVPTETREVRPCAKANCVLSENGEVLRIPPGWALVKPGDAALSRRIKKEGPTWTVKEKKGRRTFSRGIWAPSESIRKIERALELERAAPSYQKKLDSDRARRAVKQAAYAQDFEYEVRLFLDFHPRYQILTKELAKRIAAHATPVGSGTVARTERIPIEKRAEAATIAWMRHQTTAYDHMHIPRVKGKRREIRRMLAQESKTILDNYRGNHRFNIQNCPLQTAIRKG